MLLVHRRAEKARALAAALEPVMPERLYVFADGWKGLGDSNIKEECQKTRDTVLTAVSWDTDLFVCFPEENHGIRRSMLTAITGVLASEENLIVLEEDCVPHPLFFAFVARSIGLYGSTYSHIGGHQFGLLPQKVSEVFPVSRRLPDVWGWASHRQVWQEFIADVETGDLNRKFWARWRSSRDIWNLLSWWHHWKKLQEIKTGAVDSFAYLWSSFVLSNSLHCLHPNISLVTNIGRDGSGKHFTSKSLFPYNSRPFQDKNCNLEKAFKVRTSFWERVRFALLGPKHAGPAIALVVRACSALLRKVRNHTET